MSKVSADGDPAEHVVEVAVLTLTVCNGAAAGLVFLLSLVDNYRLRRSWLKVSNERRLPIYLSLSILLSSLVFVLREDLNMGSGIPFISTQLNEASQSCAALHQSTWWGMFTFDFM
jgi:hypothetical protein